MLKDFCISEVKMAGADILIAVYNYWSDDYIGHALVVFRKDNLLYEVNGSHCSCYGLENQWEPEETSAEALAMRSMDSAVRSALEHKLQHMK